MCIRDSDYWSDHPDYSGGGEFSITHEMIHDRLKYLPGNEVVGNQTIMVRAINGDNASTNSVVHLHVMGDTPISSNNEVSGFSSTVFILATLVAILAIGLILTMLMLQGAISTPEWGPFGGGRDNDFEVESDESLAESKASSRKNKS